MIWLTVSGLADNGEQQAVAVVQEIADLAAVSQLRVALYPHVGFYVARGRCDADYAEGRPRANVGVTLNLCHFLKLDDEKNLRTRLEEVIPHLYLVSINGADGGDTQSMGWDRLIQRLDRGSFNVFAMLKMLKELGYNSPIGLQCYQVAGAPRENLKQSMSAWQRFVVRMDGRRRSDALPSGSSWTGRCGGSAASPAIRRNCVSLETQLIEKEIPMKAMIRRNCLCHSIDRPVACCGRLFPTSTGETGFGCGSDFQ